MATDENSLFFSSLPTFIWSHRASETAKKKAKDTAGYGTHFPPQNVGKESITGTKLKEVLQWKLDTFSECAFATCREDTAISSNRMTLLVLFILNIAVPTSLETR